MEVNTLYYYLDRINTLVRVEARSDGRRYNLQPVHLEVLHYLTICNRYSDTPKAVTDYLSQTKGTVSQTIKVLEDKALLVKKSDDKDKRVVHLEVSPLGKALLKNAIPSDLFVRACAQIDSGLNLDKSIDVLKELLVSMQKMNCLKSFGVCRSCKFNQKDDNDWFFCGLTNERLSNSDVELICQEHQNKI